MSDVRRRNHDAIYPTNKTQDPRIALALTRAGKADPETYYFSAALRHWRRECVLNINFAEDITDYWQYIREKNGPTLGPVHHIHKILKKLGIHGITPTFWEFEDGAVDITHISDFMDLVLKACRNRAWRLAGERNRDNLIDIRHGVNVDETLRFYELAKTPGQHGRIRTILSDGIYTPWKSNLKHGGDHHCPYCQ